VNNLVAAARHNLAYLSPPGHHYTYTERARGILDATALANVVIPPRRLFACGNTTRDSFYAARTLLTQNPEIDGLICFNDITAIGALEACDELGVPVPDQVAIIGFDDIPLAGLNRISLTTMRVPKSEIGAKAVQMLFRHMDQIAGPTEIVMKTELVQRRTTPRIHQST
jgi:LacI family transcriptional regulator